MQRPGPAARGERLIQPVRVGKGAVIAERGDRVRPLVHRMQRGEVRRHDLGRRHLAGQDAGQHLAGRRADFCRHPVHLCRPDRDRN